jgi:KipI family sensor histidine kinase inhibitor
VVHIPTLYGGEYGPDLEFVAQHAGLTTEEVVSVHSGSDYLTYMMGFSPGFPYLGGLSNTLTTPRLETPRTEIPAGSVGIADSQTGVYPLASPGGWRLIGRTPFKLFDPGADPPSLLKAGDYVRFVPMATEEEYLDVRQQVEGGRFWVITEGVP